MKHQQNRSHFEQTPDVYSRKVADKRSGAASTDDPHDQYLLDKRWYNSLRTYDEETILKSCKEPDQDSLFEEFAACQKAHTKFMNFACLIAESTDDANKRHGERQYLQLTRLIENLGEDLLERRTIWNLRQHQKNFKEIFEISTTAVSQRSGGRKVRRGARTWPERFEQFHWVKLAETSRGQDWQPAYTQNFPQNYPVFHKCNQRYVADKLGYKNVEDTDDDNLNWLHVLFGGSKHCWLLNWVAHTGFEQDSPRLPGRYTVALSQLNVWNMSPMHVLLRNNDTCFSAVNVLQAIIGNRLVDVEAFSWCGSGEVAVFFVQ